MIRLTGSKFINSGRFFQKNFLIENFSSVPLTIFTFVENFHATTTSERYCREKTSRAESVFHIVFLNTIVRSIADEL